MILNRTARCKTNAFDPLVSIFSAWTESNNNKSNRIMGRDEKMSTGSSSQPDMMNIWLMRFLALLIDSIVLGIIVGVIYVVVVFWLIAGGGWFLWYSWLVLPFVLGILSLLYFPVMESSSGATLGKKLIGLQVQTTSGGRVTFDKALIRNISKIHGLFLFLDWLIAVASPGPDPRQKYTDRIAGTTVVSVKAGFASGAVPPPPPPPKS